jgi:hypothetical protein
MVVWVDWAQFPARVRRWTQADGQKVLFQAPNDVGGIALSDTKMVFLDVTGPLTQLGSYVTARIDWLDLTSDPGSVVLHPGPDITGTVSGGPLVSTAGSFVAIEHMPPNSTPDQFGVQIVDLSTSKRWRVLPPPNRYFMLAGLSTTDLLVKETDFVSGQALNTTTFQRWKRFDMAHVADFATPIP